MLDLLLLLLDVLLLLLLLLLDLLCLLLFLPPLHEALLKVWNSYAIGKQKLH